MRGANVRGTGSACLEAEGDETASSRSQRSEAKGCSAVQEGGRRSPLPEIEYPPTPRHTRAAASPSLLASIEPTPADATDRRTDEPTDRPPPDTIGRPTDRPTLVASSPRKPPTFAAPPDMRTAVTNSACVAKPISSAFSWRSLTSVSRRIPSCVTVTLRCQETSKLLLCHHGVPNLEDRRVLAEAARVERALHRAARRGHRAALHQRDVARVLERHAVLVAALGDAPLDEVPAGGRGGVNQWRSSTRGRGVSRGHRREE